MSELQNDFLELPDSIIDIETNDSAIYPQAYEIAIAGLAHDYNRQARNQELRDIASIDSKTGLLNAGAFGRELERKLSPHNRRSDIDSVHSLLMLDVDHFKHVNDSAGHLVGDKVLRTLGTILKDSQREDDLAGRFGGEEFTVLLHNTPPAKALTYLRRLRENITTTRAESWEAEIHVSIGLAEIKQGAGQDAIATAFAQADAALYYVKHHGRNNAAIFDSEPLKLIF